MRGGLAVGSGGRGSTGTPRMKSLGPWACGQEGGASLSRTVRDEAPASPQESAVPLAAPLISGHTAGLIQANQTQPPPTPPPNPGPQRGRREPRLLGAGCALPWPYLMRPALCCAGHQCARPRGLVEEGPGSQLQEHKDPARPGQPRSQDLRRHPRSPGPMTPPGPALGLCPPSGRPRVPRGWPPLPPTAGPWLSSEGCFSCVSGGFSCGWRERTRCLQQISPSADPAGRASAPGAGEGACSAAGRWAAPVGSRTPPGELLCPGGGRGMGKLSFLPPGTCWGWSPEGN